MPTQFTIQQTEKALREYRTKHLRGYDKRDQNETATRMLYVDKFIEDVLGYDLKDDICVEQQIRDRYADYVIKLGRKEYFVIEAKAIGIDLNPKHLEQSRRYALDEGIDWAILTNGRQVELYRIMSNTNSPVKIFSFDLTDLSSIRSAAKHIAYITKKSVIKNELEIFWKRFDALTPENLKKTIYSSEVVRAIRLKVRKNSGVNFTDSEVTKSLGDILPK